MATSVDSISSSAFTNPVATSVTAPTQKAEDTRAKLTSDDFLKLFVTSLQYQDPMSPMENSEMMQQMSQLTMIEQTTKMTQAIDKLQDVMAGKEIERGVGFLGKTIEATNDDGETVIGTVDGATLNADGILELLVKDQEFQIGQISKIGLEN